MLQKWIGYLKIILNENPKKTGRDFCSSLK